MNLCDVVSSTQRKAFRCAALAVLAMLSVTVADLAAQTGWSRASLRLDGGLVHAFASDASGTVYAGTHDGVYVYRDGRWVHHGLDLPVRSLLATDEGLVAGTDAGIYLFDAVWTRVKSGGIVPSLATTSTGALLAGHSSEGILRSSDGGRTWRSVRPDAFVNAFAVDGTTVLASQGAPLLVSQDDGLTWATVDTDVFSYDVMRIGPDSFLLGADVLKVTTNRGVSWSTIDSIAVTRFDRASNGTLYLLARRGTGRSVPGLWRSGASWNSWSLLWPGDANAIHVTDGRIWLASGVDVIASNDNGRTWARRSEGLHASVIASLTGVSERSLYALSTTVTESAWWRPATLPATGSLFHSTDVGSSWSHVRDSVSRLIHADAMGTVLAYGETIVNDRLVPRLHSSRDFGTTWSTHETAAPPVDSDSGNGIIAVAFANGHLSVPNPRCELWVTTDRGEQWDVRPMPQLFDQLVVTRSGRLLATWYAEGEDNRRRPVYASDDRGVTWAIAAPAANDPAIDRSPSGEIYLRERLAGATTATRLYRSDDEGRTWVDLGQLDGTGRQPFMFTRGGSIFLLSNRGLERSTDRGATFVASAPPGWVPGPISIQTHGDSTLFILNAIRGADALIHRSTDLGASWADITFDLPGAPVTEATVVEGTVLVGTRGSAVFRLVDEASGVRGERMLSDALSIAPNPADRDAVLSLESTRDLAAAMTITSVRGVRVREREILLTRGLNHVPMDIDGIASGVYIVAVVTPERVFTQRLIVH
jgi:photosystem II stability/assembly factor-like uncharacterized protein